MPFPSTSSDEMRLIEYSADQARDDHGRFAGDAAGASGRASQLSGRANAASKAAGNRAQHRDAAIEHGAAATAHSVAAEMHRDEGNNAKAAYHERQAAKHEAASASHRSAARGKSKEAAGLQISPDGLELIEASCDLTSSDVRTRLSGAISDKHRGTGSYAYYVDHAGDGESGDVVYSRDSKVYKAPYTIGGGDNGASAKVSVDFDNEGEVVPRTIYEEPADEDEHYAGMAESFKRDGLYTDLPVYERFIAKGERDAADESDFAGKGKSFPILKPEDVQAAVHAMGRAGSGNLGPSGIKARIISIAKRKGWTKYLPKAWQDASSSEATRRVAADLKLTEGAGFLGTIAVAEASRANYPVKLISPGTGSTAHYPAAVLERDGPKIFKRGTLMFWNHPTAAEEAARPEGNLDNLAAILTSDAKYLEGGPKGPGLYAEAKVMADYAQKVEERAPHIGLSIRAGGKGTGRLVDGKPELASLEYAESVDYVTKAGRGGLALAEAARDAGILPIEKEGTADMTEAEIKLLVEAGVKAATAPLMAEITPLRERALRGDAQVESVRIFEAERITLPAPSKQRAVDAVFAAGIPKTANGELDKPKFKESLIAATKAEGEYLGQIGATGNGRIVGMGSAPVSIEDGKKLKEAQEAEKAEREAILKESASVFTRLCGNAKAGEAAARKGMVA